ncbi:MAG: Holliday junction branch migration DNA helicase RuvB [Candidatus Nanopelagicales bacterium]
MSEDPRLVDGYADVDDRAWEGALRPARLDEFVGQPRVRAQLEVVLQAASARGRSADHVLLSGPPGLGYPAAAARRRSAGRAGDAGDLAAVLSGLQPGEVLFIDEIHRVARAAEEMLYLAMEDFRVDIMVGKGPGATALPIEIAPFTLVGATTRAGLLPGPLRDRFGFTAHLDYYDDDDILTILQRSAGLLGVDIDAEGAQEVARRSRGTPRIANRLLRRVRDWAEVHGDRRIDLATARAALDLYEVDVLGLDRLDRAVLDALIRRFDGGPVGLTTLAVAVGEEAETVETVAEPFLVRCGFLVRTPRGRVATPAGWAHLGLAPGSPAGALELPLDVASTESE